MKIENFFPMKKANLELIFTKLKYKHPEGGKNKYFIGKQLQKIYC